MKIKDDQHRDWYIFLLLPHLRLPLSQQKIGMQAEAIEILMRLEASLVQDTNVGVQQVQSQLEILHMELQSLKIGKEAQPKVRVEVWCIKCKDKGHDKGHCPIYQNYLIGGGPVPLKLENIAGPSTRVPLWCVICLIMGSTPLIIVISCKSLFKHHNNYFVLFVNRLDMMSKTTKAMC